MNFKSDNTAYVSPEILQAICDANEAHADPYGKDRWSQALEAKLKERFECPLRVFLTSTGTAANSLALSALTCCYGSILCHEQSHIHTDEAGGPELFTGAKLTPFPDGGGKLDTALLESHIRHCGTLRPHTSKPAVISVTQSTELGTVYSIDELQAVQALAGRYGLRIHMDGARFANALVALRCSPAEMTWRVGVDVLCLGATKNGAMAGEAVILFDLELAREFDYRIKRGGQLMSKMRYLAAQMLAYFENDLWLRNARHANQMAQKLAAVIEADARLKLTHRVQANELFVEIPPDLAARFQERGASFYEWGAPGCGCYRLVTSFITTDTEIEAFRLALSA